MNRVSESLAWVPHGGEQSYVTALTFLEQHNKWNSESELDEKDYQFLSFSKAPLPMKVALTKSRTTGRGVLIAVCIG